MSHSKLIALTLAASCLAAFGGTWIVSGKGSHASGTSYTQKQTQGNDSDQNHLSDAGNTGMGSSFTASSSYGLRKVSVRLLKQGSPTFTITARVYSDTGGSGPGTQTGSDSTTTINSSTLTGSYADYEFIFPSDISLTNGTKYWIVLIPSVQGDGSNYVQWSGNPSGTQAQYSLNSSTWILTQSSMDGSLTTYSSP